MRKIIVFSFYLFLLTFTLFSYLFVDFNLSYLHSFYTGFVDNRTLATIIYISLIATFFIFYSLFWRMYSKGSLGKKDIKWIVGVTATMLLFSYPAMLSYDIFNYILTAKVLYFYGENPYIIMPIQLVGDPLLAFTHAANKIALYGPTWLGLTSIPHFLGLGNFIFTLLSFKLLASIFYLGTSWILYKMSKDFLSIIIFSLNPLVIIETLVSGHNDIAVVFFTLSGLFFLSRKKTIHAFLFLLLSFFIKYSTLFIFPVFLYILQRQRKRTIDWAKIYVLCWFLMFMAFLMSPIREEIYPWYAIWFLPFAVLSKNKNILYISLAFSFSLLFRYVPYMLLGTHLGPSPLIKTSVTFVPVFLVSLYIFIKERVWEKSLFRF